MYKLGVCPLVCSRQYLITPFYFIRQMASLKNDDIMINILWSFERNFLLLFHGPYMYEIYTHLFFQQTLMEGKYIKIQQCSI